MPRLLPRLIPLLLPLALQAAEVKVSEDERSYTLDNGVTRATVNRRTGTLDALWFAGTDLLKGGEGYWSFVGESDRHSVGGAGTRATSSVRTRKPERAEVAVHLEPSGRPGELPASAKPRTDRARNRGWFEVARGQDRHPNSGSRLSGPGMVRCLAHEGGHPKPTGARGLRRQAQLVLKDPRHGDAPRE